MKKIGIIGQFPPPIHGLSKALDTLYKSELKTKYELVKFDITDNKKFINILFNIIRSDLDIYYLTISQSKFGNIRDLIILKIIENKRKKSIIHLHGGGFRNVFEEEFSRFQKKINRRILGRVDRAIVLGDTLRHVFDTIIDQKKIFIVKNCVDNECVLNNIRFNNKLNIFIKKEKLNILYLSNFIEDKGYKEVLKLANYFNKKNNNKFRFIFAGKFFCEKDRQEFFNYIRDNKLGNLITYKGVVYGKEKISLIESSDYFILLTKYKNEGQPISIIEAAINGVRIVTTDHAGIKDILKESEMIIYDKKNINISKIYNDLNLEYKNRENIKRILIENREKLKNEFSEKKYLISIDRIFNDI